MGANEEITKDSASEKKSESQGDVAHGAVERMLDDVHSSKNSGQKTESGDKNLNKWVGKTVDEMKNDPQMKGENIKVHYPGQPVTMESSPNRINVDVDRSGKITNVYREPGRESGLPSLGLRIEPLAKSEKVAEQLKNLTVLDSFEGAKKDAGDSKLEPRKEVKDQAEKDVREITEAGAGKPPDLNKVIELARKYGEKALQDKEYQAALQKALEAQGIKLKVDENGVHLQKSYSAMGGASTTWQLDIPFKGDASGAQFIRFGTGEKFAKRWDPAQVAGLIFQDFGSKNGPQPSLRISRS